MIRYVALAVFAVGMGCGVISIFTGPKVGAMIAVDYFVVGMIISKAP